MTITQIQLFIIFIINGIIIGVIFDIFRILRKTFKYKDYMVYLQDILFWILVGISILYCSFMFNNGELRIFMIFACINGFAIYMYTLSKIFIKINVKIILFIKKTILKIIEILLIPVKILLKFIKKILFKPATFLVINTNKIFRRLKMSKNNKNKIKEGFCEKM